MTSDEQGSAFREPDSEGCLFVVGSYTDVAGVVGPAAAEAADRIMMSPVLGDFIELRFVDIGPYSRKGPSARQAAERTAAVTRITQELTQPGFRAGRNYFALVIADWSAEAVVQVLDECGANPVVATLPIRSRGLASKDDRRPRGELAAGAALAPKVKISPTDSWGHDDLVAELRRYAEKLLHDFATGHEPGLTSDQLDLLQPGNDGTDGNSPELEQHPARLQAPDPLRPQGRSAQPKTPRLVRPARTASSPGTSIRPAWLKLPALPGRRSHVVKLDADGSAVDAIGRSPTSGLVFLMLSSDEGSGDQAAWRRGKSVMLDVGKKLAGTPRIVYRVRALSGVEDAARSKLRPAGQLSKHDFKRPATNMDFARALGLVRTAMKRDLETLEQSATKVAIPALVFFAVDVPLADAITAQVYNELAQEALIIWVIPQRSADLISSVFAGSNARIIIDHHEVADEIVHILRSNTQEAR